MNRTNRVIDGILNVNKPYGMTSMEVVRRVKRFCEQKRVGHGGTLDPVATGVIPISLGQATRMMEYVVDGRKAYRATIQFGITTDTYDSLGEVVLERNASSVEIDDIERAFKAFDGQIMQVPPMYSALKKQGKRLYDLARAGVEVEREPRPVIVHGLNIVDWSPPHLTVDVSCGRGFYMRSFAYDIGEALGCGGHLTSLERTRSGHFRIENAKTLDEVQDMFEYDTWQEWLFAPDIVLSNMRAVILERYQEDFIKNGRPLTRFLVKPIHDDEQFRAYGVDGGFIGVIKFETRSGQWKPEKVFSINYPESKVHARFT